MNPATIALLLFCAFVMGWGMNFLVQRWLNIDDLRRSFEEENRAIAVLEKEIEHLSGLNKDLLDRLFQSKAMPPSGVDLAQVYEDRKLKEHEHKERSGKKVPAGPIERLVDKWADDDLKAAEKGIDYTEPQRRAN